MIRTSLLAAVITAALIGQGAAQPPDVQDVFPGGLIHDFGKVKHGEIVSRDILIVNPGKTPLMILNIRTGSSVLQATASQEVLRPGERATLRLALDCRRFLGPKTVACFVNILSEGEVSQACLSIHAISCAEQGTRP